MERETQFGHYRPRPILAWLLSSAQNAPRNWIGQQYGQIVRKILVNLGSLPIDLNVGCVRMRCYLKDNNSEYKFAFMPWRFDQFERDYLVRSIPADGVFLDIGANVGIYTLHMATHLSSAARIVSFEPNPPAYKRLEFNVISTKAVSKEWPKIDLLPFAVGDRSKVIDLHLGTRNLGSSSIASQSRGAGAVKVACKPLLTILAELGIEKVHALKIDIEGAEDMALVPYLGNVRDEHLPDCIVIENSEHLWKQDLVGALNNRGYKSAFRNKMNTVYQRG